MIIIIICIISALIIAPIYLLVPLPLLSYQQGSIETYHGEITEVKSIRPGVLEVSLRQRMEIDPQLQKGNVRMTSATCTRFIHFRKGQMLPKIGDNISVSSVNKMHRFTGRSFDWVKRWELFNGILPTEGKVLLVTA